MRVLAHILTPTGAIRAWASTLMLILGFGLALGLTIGYVAETRRQDDARMCRLLDVLLAPQPSTPPQTPQEQRSRAVAKAMRDYYHELGCGHQ